VHAKYSVLNEGRHGEVVEEIDELLPELGVVSALALIPESVHFIDVLALVIAPQQEYVVGVLYFIGKQQAHCLDTLLAPIYIVSQEQIIGLWGCVCNV